VEILILLIKKEEMVLHNYNFYIALFYAIMNDNYTIIKYLLIHGIDMEHKEYIKEQTAIFTVFEYRAYNSLKLLIENNCDLNKQE
jgi:hypothetical protein